MKIKFYLCENSGYPLYENLDGKKSSAKEYFLI